MRYQKRFHTIPAAQPEVAAHYMLVNDNETDVNTAKRKKWQHSKTRGWDSIIYACASSGRKEERTNLPRGGITEFGDGNWFAKNVVLDIRTEKFACYETLAKTLKETAQTALSG